MCLLRKHCSFPGEMVPSAEEIKLWTEGQWTFGAGGHRNGQAVASFSGKTTLLKAEAVNWCFRLLMFM